MNSIIRKSARKLSFIFACALFVVTALGSLDSIPVRAETKQISLNFTDGRSYDISTDMWRYSDYIKYFAFYDVYGQFMSHSDFVTEGSYKTATYYYGKDPYQALVVKKSEWKSGYSATLKADDNCLGEYKVVLNKKNLEEFYKKRMPAETQEEYAEHALESMKLLEDYIDNNRDGDGSSEYVFILKFGKPESVKKTITLDFRDGNKYEGIGEYDFYTAVAEIINEIGEYWGTNEYYDEEIEEPYYKTILSTNPKQVICSYDTGEYSVLLSAEDGCAGEYSIVLNKDTFKEAMDKKYPDDDNDFYAKIRIQTYEKWLGDIEDGDGLSEYTFIFKFGTKPVEEKPIDNPNADKPSGQTPAQEVTPAQETAPQQAAANQVDEAPKYVPGTKFEVKGLKYEIIDTAGNVKLKGIKSKNVKSISVPATVKHDGASLKVTTIGTGAIKGLKKLTKVTLGANVTTLQKHSIYGCKKLNTLTINSTKLTSVAKKAVGSNAKGFKIKVKKNSLKGYKSLFKKAGMGKISIK